MRAAAAGAMLEAIGMARAGQLAEAHKRLDVAAGEVRAAMAKYKDDELAGVLAELESVGKDNAQLVVVAPAPTPKLPMEAAADAPVSAPAPIERDLRRKEDHAVRTVHGR